MTPERDRAGRTPANKRSTTVLVPAGRPALNDAKRHLALLDIADDLGVSLSTVQTWCARRWPHFPRCSRLPNGRIRVRIDDYEEWLESLRVT